MRESAFQVKEMAERKQHELSTEVSTLQRQLTEIQTVKHIDSDVSYMAHRHRWLMIVNTHTHAHRITPLVWEVGWEGVLALTNGLVPLWARANMFPLYLARPTNDPCSPPQGNPQVEHRPSLRNQFLCMESTHPDLVTSSKLSNRD